MPLDRPRAQAELRGDGLVAQPARGRREDLEFSRGERLEADSAGATGDRDGTGVGFHECSDLAQRHRPRRIVGQQDVVRALEFDQPRVRDPARLPRPRSRTSSSGHRSLQDQRGRPANLRHFSRRCRRPGARSGSPRRSPARSRVAGGHRTSCICCSVASGMKMRVKTRRNSGPSFAQPTQQSVRLLLGKGVAVGTPAGRRPCR